VIGGYYFGERFVGNYFQIDDNISVIDLWTVISSLVVFVGELIFNCVQD
jgi:hypothetical protein